MTTADTLLLVGGILVVGWYAVNYVLPSLPQLGQFTPVAGGTPVVSSNQANGTCKAQSGGVTCYRDVACSSSNPVNGVSYRNKSVSWCVGGTCAQAKTAWTNLFKCVSRSTTPPKVLNPQPVGTGRCAGLTGATLTACQKGTTNTGLSCTCGAGYVRDTTGSNATKCVCKLKPAPSGNASQCAGLTGATYTACLKAHGLA